MAQSTEHRAGPYRLLACVADNVVVYRTVFDKARAQGIREDGTEGMMITMRGFRRGGGLGLGSRSGKFSTRRGFFVLERFSDGRQCLEGSWGLLEDGCSC